MKLLMCIVLFLVCSLKQAPVFSEQQMTSITGNYTIIKALNSVRPALDKALERQGIDPKQVDLKFVSHYESYDVAKAGDLTIGGFPRSIGYTLVNYQIPLIVYYNKKTFRNDALDLNADDFRQIVKSAIEEKPFRHLNRPLIVSFGAIAGCTKRAFAAYTGIPYARIKQFGENPNIPLSDNQFVDNAIKNNGYDLVATTYPLDLMFFKVPKDDPYIGVATIEGKTPGSPDYPLNDHAFYVSYNEANINKQKAIANALNDPHLKEALKKIGFQFVEKDLDEKVKYFVETRPDLFKSPFTK
jgi:hypothetical protein